MPGTLIDKIEEVAGSNTWVNSSLRTFSQTGTPLVSSILDERIASLFPDTYILTFTNVVPGVSAKVIVTTLSKWNPYKNPSGYVILLDGNTPYDYIIPGSIQKFSSNGGFLNTWQAIIKVGRYDGLAPNYGVAAGVQRTYRKHQIYNSGVSVAKSVKVSIKNNIQHVSKIGKIFSFVHDFAKDSTPKITSNKIAAYELLITATSGSGDAKIATFTIDGELINVKNVNTNVESLSENLNVLDDYVVISGNLKDFLFGLDSDVSLSSSANIFSIPADFIDVALDDAGSPDDFTHDFISLGDIAAGATKVYWEAVTVNSGANSLSNPRMLKLEFSAEVDDMTEWI